MGGSSTVPGVARPLITVRRINPDVLPTPLKLRNSFQHPPSSNSDGSPSVTPDASAASASGVQQQQQPPPVRQSGVTVDEDGVEWVVRPYNVNDPGAHLAVPQANPNLAPPGYVDPRRPTIQFPDGRTHTLSYVIEDYVPPSVTSNHDLKNSFQWETKMTEPDFCAAPVTAFKHVSAD